MSTFVFCITALGYLISTVAYIVYLVNHRDKFSRIGFYALSVSVGFHTLLIISRWIDLGYFPATNLHQSLTLFAWLLALIAATAICRYKYQVFGAFASPLILMLVIMASFLPQELAHMNDLIESYWLPVHVTLAVLGNAFFALAFVIGLMYLIQDRELKKKKLGGMYFVLPPLETLDELTYKCIVYGFILLTFGILTGLFWNDYTTGKAWSSNPRLIWSLITWCLYAALIHGRMVTGWRGRTAAIFASIAFLILVGSFIFLNYILGPGHGLFDIGQVEQAGQAGELIK